MSDGIRISTNNFKYAGPEKRLLAWVIDFPLVNLFLLLFIPGFWQDWLVFIPNLLSGKADLLGFMTSGSFLFFAITPFIYLSVMGGLFSRTVGMMIAKIRIADLKGEKIAWLTAVLRAFSFLLFAAVTFGLFLLPILFDKKRQGIHDKVSRTMVIIKR